MNSARDLRIQADRVELVLQERINELHSIREKLEIDLKEVNFSQRTNFLNKFKLL